MTLSIIAIILSALGLIFVWLLKNIVQSDVNGLRDAVRINSQRDDMLRSQLISEVHMALDRAPTLDKAMDNDFRAASEIAKLSSDVEWIRGKLSFTVDRVRQLFESQAAVRMPDIAALQRLVTHILETIALMDPPAHGFRIVCHRKRYYIEAVRFHDQGGAAFHTELDHEFSSFAEADAVVKALLEARSTKQKIVYHPVIIPKDDVC